MKPPDEGLAGAMRALGVALMRPAAAPERAGWGWPGWIAAAAIAGIAIGLGRFALGLAAVAALRRGSQPVDDPDLLELASVLRQRLGVGPRVELRVAPGLAMPATIGWRRPLILLPEDWPAWDDRERRVVLAHELAHIRRNDYLAGVWAQLSLAPAVLPPAGAPARSAAPARPGAGGRRLGSVALGRESDLPGDARPAGPPQRAATGRLGRPVVLSGPRHFPEEDRDAPRLERRLSRPRSRDDPGRMRPRGPSAWRRSAWPGSAAPVPENEARPRNRRRRRSPSGPTVDLGFIPADAGMVAVTRPAELMASARVPSSSSLRSTPTGRAHDGFSPADGRVEQVTVLWLPGGDRQRGLEPSGVADPRDEAAGLERDGRASVQRRPTEEIPFGEFTYLRHGQENASATRPPMTGRSSWPRSRPCSACSPPGRATADRRPWAEAWKEIKKGQVAVAVDTTWLAGAAPAGARRPAARRADSPLDGFEPLVSKAQTYAVGVDVLAGLRIDGFAPCDTDARREAVADTLKRRADARPELDRRDEGPGGAATPSTRRRRRDWRQRRRAAARRGRGQARRPDRPDLGDTPLPVADLVAAMAAGREGVPRAAAKRTQSVNNLKQLGLAMHNYAQAHGGRFPAAAMFGPDGKTPYSWRVAVLPYLEQNDLYKQYNFNEPWDGPNNRKLLDKMPAIFAHPDGPRNSPAYYMPTGPHTISSDNQGSIAVPDYRRAVATRSRSSRRGVTSPGRSPRTSRSRGSARG